jgi:hypothetical protein
MMKRSHSGPERVIIEAEVAIAQLLVGLVT